MFAGLVPLLAAALAGAAPDIHVEPALLEIPADQEAAEVWVSNPGDRPWAAQASLYDWSQRIDGEQLAPTGTLIPSPARFTIPAGGRQRLRLVRTRPAPGGETAFRLILDQQADPQTPGATRLRHSSAVFISPAVPQAPPHLRVETRGDTTHPALVLHNAGGIHARITELAWIDPQGHRHLLQPGLAGYVLAGTTRRWPLPAHASGYAGGRFEAQINQGRPQTLETATLAAIPAH